MNIIFLKSKHHPEGTQQSMNIRDLSRFLLSSRDTQSYCCLLSSACFTLTFALSMLFRLSFLTLYWLYIFFFFFFLFSLPCSHSLPPCLSLALSLSLWQAAPAVSQYHGGWQWGCCSGGKCSSWTARSHRKSWHLWQVRLTVFPHQTSTGSSISPGLFYSFKVPVCFNVCVAFLLLCECLRPCLSMPFASLLFHS